MREDDIVANWPQTYNKIEPITFFKACALVGMSQVEGQSILEALLAKYQGSFTNGKYYLSFRYKVNGRVVPRRKYPPSTQDVYSYLRGFE